MQHHHDGSGQAPPVNPPSSAESGAIAPAEPPITITSWEAFMASPVPPVHVSERCLLVCYPGKAGITGLEQRKAQSIGSAH